MGTPGTAKNRQRTLVLDAGALIAYEKGDPRARAILKMATAAVEVVIPASIVAEVWRGGSRAAPLARLFDASEIDPLDEMRAREVGVRLGARAVKDVGDSHVVCCALARDAKIVTSDPEDMRALAEPGESLSVISI